MNRLKLILWITLCLSISSTQASIVLDIAAPMVGRSCWRVIAFDTKRQALLHYETLPPSPFSRPLSSFLKGHRPNKDVELTYTISANEERELSISAGANAPRNVNSSRHYMLTSSAAMRAVNLPPTTYNKCLDKNYWASTPIKERTPAQIRELVRGLANKRTDLQEFQLIAHDDKGLHLLSELTSDNKGLLGELITQMTMFSFGYDFTPTHYKGKQGLDGMFLSFSREYLVLSQSKLGNSNNMAGTVIQKELSEAEIAQRLALMGIYGSEDVKVSQQLAYQFIKDHPDRVYKLAQCLFNSGRADFVIKPFDVQKYPTSASPLYGAKREEKVLGVSTTLGVFEPEPLAQLKLALSAIRLQDIPRRQFLACMLANVGLDESTQVQYLNLLDSVDEE